MRWVSALVVLIVALSTVHLVPAAGLTPLVVGWEQYFKVDWQAEMRGSRPLITGHVLNDWGMPAGQVQLLLEGLDQNGQVVVNGWNGSAPG